MVMQMRWAVRFLVASLFFAAAGMAMAQAAPVGLTMGSEQFSPTDIVDARAQPELDGRISVLVTLEEPAAARLATVTQALIGKPMPIVHQGKILSEPIVRDPITAGAFLISGAFSMEEAKALALAISGKPPLADSLEDE